MASWTVLTKDVAGDTPLQAAVARGVRARGLSPGRPSSSRRPAGFCCVPPMARLRGLCWWWRFFGGRRLRFGLPDTVSTAVVIRPACADRPGTRRLRIAKLRWARVRGGRHADRRDRMEAELRFFAQCWPLAASRPHAPCHARAPPLRRALCDRLISGTLCPMTVAIVDYGSGNLHSAARPSSGRAGHRCRACRRHQRSRLVRGARSRGPARRLGAFADAAGPDGVAGHGGGAGGDGARQRAARSWASASACNCWPSRAGARHHRRPRLDQGGGGPHHPVRSGAEDPAHGLEPPSARPAPIRCWTVGHLRWRRRAACYFVLPTRSNWPIRPTSLHHQLWRHHHGDGGARQCGRTQFHPEKSQRLGLSFSLIS